jgi:S-DNA-T family DNA segregation ATPase FtsK/SpoIIIE
VSAWEPPAPGWICAECAFEYDAYGPSEIVEAFAGFGRRYRTPLTRGLPGEHLDVLVRARPAPATWSALEYACHVRDVFGVTEHRIGRALTEDRPQFRRVDPDAAASERHYNVRDPATVVTEIDEVASGLVARLGGVAGSDWERAGVRDGEALTVHWLAVNAVHEGAHHLLDIGRALRQARGR